jgi:hypothetical protein
MSGRIQFPCTLNGRLASGDIDALMSPNRQLKTYATELTANTTGFFLDTDQVPSSQFWNVSQWSVTVLLPDSQFDVSLGYSDPGWIFMLMPPQLVGAPAFSVDPQIQPSQVITKNLGIVVGTSTTDIANGQVASPTNGDLHSSNPINSQQRFQIPPLWFFRALYVYNGTAGDVAMAAGTQIRISLSTAIVPIPDFLSAS